MNASFALRVTAWMLLSGGALGALPLLSAPAGGQKTAQVAANHMRWNNNDAALENAIAWQEEGDGHWVTVVLLTDQPIPPALVTGKSAHDLMEETKTQGVSFAVRTGGVPLPEFNFHVGYRDEGRIGTPTATGTGGFEIDSQSATQIKGRTVYQPFVVGTKD